MSTSPQFRGQKNLPEEAGAGWSVAESNLLHYRGLVSRAVEAFGDEIKASRWLSSPNSELNGQTPIQAVQANGYDLQALEPLFTRIEHGVDY